MPMLKLTQLLNDISDKKPLEIKDDPFIISPTYCALNFIGDVHGAKYWYQDTCYRSNYSIQVGDIINSPDLHSYFSGLDPTKHRYIHGNHDWLKDKPPANYLGRYGIWYNAELDLKIGFISGAYSVDRARRIGLSYDPVHDNEELSIEDLEHAILLLQSEQPDVIVTHSAPYSIFGNLRLLPQYGKIKTKTSQALDIVLENCSPTLWVFGHFHQDVHFVHQNRVTFACVNMNTTLPFV